MLDASFQVHSTASWMTQILRTGTVIWVQPGAAVGAIMPAVLLLASSVARQWMKGLRLAAFTAPQSVLHAEAVTDLRVATTRRRVPPTRSLPIGLAVLIRTHSGCR